MVLKNKNALTYTLIALTCSPLVGCGSSGSTAISTVDSAGPSGKSIQGAVSGATVWADGLSTGTQFVIDSTEQDTQTTTATAGTFSLPKTPSYKYVVVSQGGTDTLTGRPATTMIGPPGAKSTSSFTSMVMFDSTGNVGNLLSSLLPGGASFDTDFTAAGSLSPASMVLLTSLTTAITSVDVAIQQAATKSGATLSAQQLNAINLTIYSQLATQFATLSSTTLANTQGLSINLQTALTNALTSISSNNPNIKGIVPGTIASSVANSSVAIAANVVGNATGNAALKGLTAANVQTQSVSVSTTATVTESSVVSGSNLQLIVSDITNTANSVSSALTVSSTPSTYSPPKLSVVNNPTVAGYNLSIVPNGAAYAVKTFTISFSDDMVATSSGGTNYAHSVMNPANYTFTQTGCTPASYASNTVTFTCSDLKPGAFGITIPKATSSAGVWASSTSLGLLVNTTKTFTLPSITGASGGSSYNLF